MEYLFLWMYVAGYIIFWVYLPIVEWKDETPGLRWFSIVIHSAAAVAIIVYLTDLKTVEVPVLWWALLGATAIVTVAEDVMAYKRLMKKTEPRISRRGNVFAALSGSFVEAAMRIPCLVVIYRLAERG